MFDETFRLFFDTLRYLLFKILTVSPDYSMIEKPENTFKGM